MSIASSRQSLTVCSTSGCVGISRSPVGRFSAQATWSGKIAVSKSSAPVRVVSLPCFELFEEQDKEYRDEVLPPGVTARLSVEAGVCQGWDRYVGTMGAMICLNRFGGSAPGDVALRELGFNVENVLKHARALL